MEFSPFLTMKDAALYLKCSESTIQKLSASGRIPKYKPTNGRVYFKKEDLNRFIEQGKILEGGRTSS